ncbi:MAG: protein kinase [Chloracidobacterium sp.]
MIGSVIGTYRVTDRLGAGGMGTVYRGVDVMLDRPVAIKVLKPELVANPQLIERFRTEAVLLGKLNHPNIATLYGFLPIDGQQFAMVMEFLPGTALDTLLHQSGAMPLPRVVPLFSGVLDAIGYAHRRGIIHRDIKPSNVIVLPDGMPKVMDFGIARAMGSSRQTRFGAIIGTLEYMSPEQIQGMETDARSDIYSLGIVLYEILTGRLPFIADNEYALLQAHIQSPPPPLRVFTPQIPEPVAQTVLRALEKDPGRRFQTAEEFKQALVLAVTPSLTFPMSNPRVTTPSLPVTHGGQVPPDCPPPDSAPPVSQMPTFQPASLPVSAPNPFVTKPSPRWLEVAAWSLAGVALVVFTMATLGYVWVHNGVAAPESHTPPPSQPPRESKPLLAPKSPAESSSSASSEPEHQEPPTLSQPNPPAVPMPDALSSQGGSISLGKPGTSEEVASKKQSRRTGRGRTGATERERRRRESLRALDQ